MINNTTYNGWTNYATWRINLEIFDGFDPYDYFSDNQATIEDWLADSLEEYAEQVIFECSSIPEGLAMDYAKAFLSDVNWNELASHMIKEYAPESEES